MHINQPALPSRTLLNLWESDLLIHLITQPDLFETFRKLISFFVTRWDGSRGV